LDRGFLTSTILKEGPVVVACWALLLADADKLGESGMQPSVAASLLRIPDDAAEAAFKVLAAPDLKSRNVEHQGRRIIKMDNGNWQLISHGRYRDLASKSHSVLRTRKYDQNHRAREKKLPDGEWICEKYGCYSNASGVVEGKHVCSKHAFDIIEEGEPE
jgi:hypothetical protein